MKHFSEITESAERVVDVAQDLIQQHGYNGFSYDDISRVVGIKKPSIHHHFPTKLELVAVVVQRYTHRFGEQLAAISARNLSHARCLEAYAALFEATYKRDRRVCICGMLGAESDGLPTEVADEVQRFFKMNVDWLTQIFRDGQKAGAIQNVTAAKSLAMIFLCTLEGAMVVGRGLAHDAGPGKAANTFIAALTV